MIIFRMVEFVFQLCTTIFIVLLLQISIGGKTLEDYLMSFIQNSDTAAPVRDLAYSSIKKVKPDVVIKNENRGLSSSKKQAPAVALDPFSFSKRLGIMKLFDHLRSKLSLGDQAKGVQAEYFNNQRKALEELTQDADDTGLFPKKVKAEYITDQRKALEELTQDIDDVATVKD